MCERNEVTREIREIRDELKNFKSNRKATLKLLSLVSDAEIFMGIYEMYFNKTQIHENVKNKKLGGRCWVCHSRINYERNIMMHINKNKIQYYICHICKNITLCPDCLRETSRCSLIHSRKLLCWQILLSQKFPKDIIRLIAKKVK